MLHDLLTCGVDENGEIRDIEDGDYPETWKSDFLGNVVDFYSGGTPSKSRPEYWRGNFPLLTPKDMKRFELNDTSDHVTEEAASHSSKIMPSGTLFIVVRGMILAHTFPVCLNCRPFAFNQDIKAIRGREGLNTKFLAYWFLANDWKFLRKATEATHGTKKLDLDDLQKTLITFPPLTEQSVILDLIEGTNEELESEQRELFILRQLKQGLIADLLTGQVRVPPDLELP
ncbi:restriction endonuclease subunit S [Methylomagnum sp.]